MTDIRNKKIDDEMLGKVSGGAQKVVAQTGVNKSGAAKSGVTDNGVLGRRKSDCLKCNKETTFEIYSGGRAVCVECGYEKFM